MDTLRHIGLLLVCEICEGEVDLVDGPESDAGTCRSCGLAFVLDAPYAEALERRTA
jgi:hypothetical protein